MSDETISAAWGKILGVPIESIGAHIGLMAQLVPQLDQVVQSERRERLAAVVAEYRQEWLTSTFPLAQPFNQAVNPSCQAISRTSHSGAWPTPWPSLPLTAPLLTRRREPSCRSCFAPPLRRPWPTPSCPPTLPSNCPAPLRGRNGAEACPPRRSAGSEARYRSPRGRCGRREGDRREGASGSQPQARVCYSRRRLDDLTAPAQIQPALQAWEGFVHELTPAHVHVVPQAAPLQLESGPQAEEVLDGVALDATEDVGQAPTRSG